MTDPKENNHPRESRVGDHDDTKALERIAAAMETIAEALRGISSVMNPKPTGSIWLITDILIELINIRRRYVTLADAEKLEELKKKLEPYQSVREAVCLDGKDADE